MSGHVIAICSFSLGSFRVKSKSGKQSVEFDESEQFGPSFVNMRNGELRMVPERHWFWAFYPAWRAAGRPTDGTVISTPNGPLQRAVWTSDDQARHGTSEPMEPNGTTQNGAGGEAVKP